MKHKLLTTVAGAAFAAVSVMSTAPAMAETVEL